MSRLTPSLLALDKGLDLQTAKIVAPEGSVYDTLNYEQVDFQGQKRIDGYARYDGSLLPALDEYRVLEVNATDPQLANGDLLFLNDRLVGVVGNFSDGKIRYAVIDSTLTIEAGDEIVFRHYPVNESVEEWSATAISDVSGVEEGVTVDGHYSYLLDVTASLRDKVEYLPSAIAGLHWFKDRLYAVAGIQVFASAPRLLGRLPNVVCGDEVNYQYTIIGGVPPVVATISAGALPDGLTLSSTGLVTGEVATGGDAIWTVTITDAIGQTVDLVETRVGMDGFYTYLTSQLYPLDIPAESVFLSSVVEEGTLRNIYHEYAIPEESLLLSSAVVAGTLQNLFRTYDIAPEAISLNSSVTDGTLRNILLAYAIPFEGINLSSSVVEGTLRNALITTNMAPEAISLSSSVVGGTLT